MRLRVGITLRNLVSDGESQRGLADSAHARQSADGRAFVGFEVVEQIGDELFAPCEVRGRWRDLVEKRKR